MASPTQEIRETYKDYEDERIRYKDSTYEIVSKVAYLIGIKKKIFEMETEPPKFEVYKQLEKERNARIVRHLCVIRNSIEHGYGRISGIMKYENRSVFSIPEYIPRESVEQLEADGINIYKKSNTQLYEHIMELNRLIADRINNCKSLFPVWLNWSYLRDIFIMPDGLTKVGTQNAANTFFENLECYPYMVYINWRPYPCGNILYNDKKFVTLIYEWNNDAFTDMSKVSDAGSFVKDSICEFIDEASKVVMMVDCENSDPYRLCAALKGLEAAAAAKIRKIILIDGTLTVKAWGILESYTSIPVEHIQTERVKQNKSLVDIELTARTCMEHYKYLVDSFVLVSSDSDYWGLVSSLPEARFLFMVEKEKCGPDMMLALAKNGIFYCFIEDFYSGNSDDIMTAALLDEVSRQLNDALHLNANELFENALWQTHIDLAPAAKTQFFDKYLRTMSVVLDDAGNVSIALNRK